MHRWPDSSEKWLNLLQQHAKENVQFREEVKEALAKLVAGREATDKTTRHGLEFEDALGQFLTSKAQGSGDIVSATGSRVGSIKNCKVGDFVIQMCAESQAAGAKIVLEAKEDTRYTVDKSTRGNPDRSKKTVRRRSACLCFRPRRRPHLSNRSPAMATIWWSCGTPSTRIQMSTSMRP